jgi:lipopolysaccharide transport system permease protein
MWEYRELIRNLTIAELKNRYQNTSLGFFWSILSPLLFAAVLFFVFRKLYITEDNFALNLIVGIMVYRFLSTGTSFSLLSIVSKPNLVTKVYIPRYILVLSTALAALIGSLLEFIILIPIIFVLQGHIPPTIVLYPVVHVFFFFIIYGLGLILASAYVYFRDLNQIWEFVVMMLLYLSPIIYPLSVVPPYLSTYYMYNPITRLVITYRDIMVKGTLPPAEAVIIIVVFAAIMWALGNFVFNRLQRRFAEEL